MTKTPKKEYQIYEYKSLSIEEPYVALCSSLRALRGPVKLFKATVGLHEDIKMVYKPMQDSIKLQ